MHAKKDTFCHVLHRLNRRRRTLLPARRGEIVAGAVTSYLIVG
jgi:hypothetical protein